MGRSGTIWVPTANDIIAQHQDIIARTGGEQGILNPSLIHAAVHRANWGPFAGNGGILERSALLMRGIAQDHPFLDGNKRTALVITAIMLDRNGLQLTRRSLKTTQFGVQVAQGEYSLEEMISWLRENTWKI